MLCAQLAAEDRWKVCTLEEDVTVALDRLGEEPYVSVLCYPKSTKAENRKRLEELKKLGVTALKFRGEKQISKLHVLGKGCVGIVVRAFKKNEQVALKIRRVDADRATMQHEAKLLAKANSQHVGSELLGASRNFLLTRFADGLLLPEWFEKTRGRARIRSVLRNVLEQSWRLDAIGLDHGELSHAPKHIIIGETDKPVIVDFETASLERRPANVTSLCQFLFIGSETARTVAKKLGGIDKDALVEALRQYKRDRIRGNFDNVLSVCGL